jgi:hypothetical protein
LGIDHGTITGPGPAYVPNVQRFPSESRMVKTYERAPDPNLLASTYAVQLPGVIVIPVVNTSYRIEHVIWSRLGPTPAAEAFIALLRPCS